jgi:hypothetical protein
MINFNFLRRPKKPTCVSEIYEKLESKPKNVLGEITGGYERNIRVVVENIERPTRREDKSSGAKRAWAHCADGCEEKLYIVFRSGGAKSKGVSEVKFGDMEPGKAYNVEGDAMIDHHGTLVITNAQ